MNQRIKELIEQATETTTVRWQGLDARAMSREERKFNQEKFAELVVKEMCGLMGHAEDDAYHCFEPSERPTEYIKWLRDWQERFAEHFGVE